MLAAFRMFGDMPWGMAGPARTASGPAIPQAADARSRRGCTHASGGITATPPSKAARCGEGPLALAQRVTPCAAAPSGPGHGSSLAQAT